MIIPEEAPLHMPEQPLRVEKQKTRDDLGSAIWRKLALFISSIVVTTWLSVLMYRVVSVSGLTSWEWVLLIVFILNIAWISMAFCSATAGFLTTLFTPSPKRINLLSGPLKTRTAILFPIYNESVEDVFSTVLATADALSKAAPDKFDCFIISDTTDPDIALEEEAGIRKLQESDVDHCQIYYRRRTINKARKAGNVHDFVSRWGGRYDHMIIYDADSYIETDTLIDLVRRMEDDPKAGLIQTVPKLVGGTTLFSRAQEFATSVYGPVLGRGIAWWAQSEGNYWGHNAIIRMRAFADAAGLPVMPGRAPFGGHILSHDFVEAALLRRAGWKVVIASDLKGSYEEGPPSVIDLTIRDRRWCQGNLQHTAVLLRARGLLPTSRLHFTIGIMSYLASPLWLVLILVGMALSLQNRFLRPDYFSGDHNLVPNWPVIDPALALNVFFATMAVLLVPKLYGVIASIVRPGANNRSRPISTILGALIETFISALTAPILMSAQTSAVISILSGQDSGWTPQTRGGDGYRWKDVARRHAATTALGAILTISALIISPIFAAWLAPATLGMVLSIPISYWTGKPDTHFGKKGWFYTVLKSEAERHPPQSYLSAKAAQSSFHELNAPELSDLLMSGALLEQHARYVDPHWELGKMDIHLPLAMASAKLEKSDTLDEFLHALSRPETIALLNSIELCQKTHHKFEEAFPTETTDIKTFAKA